MLSTGLHFASESTVVSGYTVRTAENASSQSYDRELRGLD
jgi:hypothetical protein